MSVRQLVVLRAWPWVLALLVLAPTIRPGFVLSYDMVFVPNLAMRSDFLGLGSGLPRAVPSDALVAVLDNLVPGMLLQKLLLFAALVLAGVGARRLVPQGSMTAQLAATSFYVWNPFVAERLLIGHWPVLLAYAALPWVVDAARGVRLGRPRLPELTLWLALAGFGASGGLTAAVVAVAFGAGGLRDPAGRRRTAAVLAVVLATNAPWLVTGLMHASDAVTDARGASAFMAGGEGSLPAPLAVLGLGGIWNVEVVPGSRLGPLPWIALLVVGAVVAAGARRWWRTEARRDRWVFLCCGGGGLLVALAGVVAPGAAGWLVSTVPGGGLLRDGTRYLGLLALLETVLFASGAEVLARSSRDRMVRSALAVGVVLVPLALLPDLAWGASGRLRPVEYPASYDEVRTVLAAQSAGSGADLLVLPFTSYRAPSWNDGRKVLDPLGRYLTPDYVASDQLSVNGRVLAGEDPRGRAVLRVLARSDRAARTAGLRRLGIGFVLRDGSAPGAGSPTYDPPVAGRLLAATGTLTLRAVPGRVDVRTSEAVERVAVGLAFTAYLGALLIAVTNVLRRRVKRPTTRG